jgi:hypothetical protein
MKALFAIALAVALTTAPVAYSQTVDTQADILKAATEWMDAYNKKDATTVAKLYSADAVLSSPGWTATGRAAIEDGLKKDMAVGPPRVRRAPQIGRSADVPVLQRPWSPAQRNP